MLKQKFFFWSRAVTLAYMALKRFHINRKVKKLLKKNIDVEINSTREGIQSIRQVVDKYIV